MTLRKPLPGKQPAVRGDGSGCYSQSEIAALIGSRPRTPRKGPAVVTESQLSKQVADFLRIDGWRVLKQEPLSRAGGGRYAGELGMPDLLALRYYPAEDDAFGQGYGADVLWLEIKRLGQKPKLHQVQWHLAERALGAEVWVVDDFDKFRDKYMGSGLNRRIKT